MTVRAARRPAKPGGRKTANRFANLAGGDASPTIDPTPEGASAVEEDSGLIGAVSAAAVEALRVVQIPVAQIAPHPFNDPRRSQPQPGDPKWDELLGGVRANGVRLPVLVVPREAFLATRAAAAQHIPADARYVLVYGHRRRIAALEAGRETVPAVIDDAIMADDGDLDAMVTENLGRQDLSDLAEADLFARYSEMGLTQRAIASRLGVDQATVSRRLALLLLTPEVRQAVSRGALPSAEAATLAGALPYGPPRPWQKTKDPQQARGQRHNEQVQALRLVLDRGALAARAAERVIVERDARAQAGQWGIPIVDDPQTELGERFYEYRVAGYDGSADLIGAIDPGLGALVLYARPAPEDRSGPGDGAGHGAGGGELDADPGVAPEAGGTRPAAKSKKRGPEPSGDEAKKGKGESSDAEDAAITGKRCAETAAAQAHRRQACAALITQQVSKADLLRILVGQYLSGVAARCATSAVAALLRDWDADVDGDGEKARATRAWHRAVAAAELHTSDLRDKTWDDDAVAHIQLLIDRVGYQPTSWERDQLHAITR
jgi:ParB family chromosome partitioning protein